MPKSKSLHSSFLKSDGSNLLRVALLKERFSLGKNQIDILLFCSQKTSNLLEKPKSEFPTLPLRLSSKLTLEKFPHYTLYPCTGPLQDKQGYFTIILLTPARILSKKSMKGTVQYSMRKSCENKT